MPTLSEQRISELVHPYLSCEPPAELAAQLSVYLDLLLRWNARTNLTAIREPEEIVRRHFGEGLFAAAQLQGVLRPDATLLDFGSGAGFPGLPIQLLLPGLRVTLAESQGKKASFLREAVRSLSLSTEVWAVRVEEMPPSRTFDCVTLRAVDKIEEAIRQSRRRVNRGGLLAVLGGESLQNQLLGADSISLPENQRNNLYLLRLMAAPNRHLFHVEQGS